MQYRTSEYINDNRSTRRAVAASFYSAKLRDLAAARYIAKCERARKRATRLAHASEYLAGAIIAGAIIRLCGGF